ncbi:MAG TPA: hypothetical protein VFH06_00920 [Candidatus Saccharimonadales bacterium]|nr:hypothetical protein [Candidatus Saccharimonadales bacterium]
MPISEKINISNREAYQFYDTESPFASGTLRHSLLAGSEGIGNFAVIPRDTVMVEVNSNSITQESFAGLSHLAREAQEEKGESKSNIRERGYGKLGMGSLMSSIDMDMRQTINKDELSPNLTLLYDGSHLDVDGETQIPSAILVHEELSDLQIKELREKLPAGVPLIDGKTNRLLDEVGQAEREQGRQDISYRRNLGGFAIKDLGSYDRIRTQKILDEPIGTFNWSSYFDATIHEADEYTKRTPRTESSTYDFYEPKTESYEEVKQTATPQSDEVRTYREKVTRDEAEKDAYKEYEQRNVTKAAEEIRAVAKNLYETSDIESLNSAQLGKVERKVQSKLHPDRGFEAGGDSGAFKEMGVQMRELKKDAAAREPSQPE